MARSERKFGVVLTYVNIFLNTFVMLIYTPFILKYLGQSEYGLYALAMSILTYLALLDFGFGNAIVVLTSKYIINNERKSQEVLYSTVFTSYLFISFLSVIGMVVFYYLSDTIFAKSMSESEVGIFKILILILAFNIAISIPGNMFRTILTAYEKFIFINGLSIIRALSIPLLTIVAIFFEYRTIAMIASVTIVNLLFLFVQYVYFRKHVSISVGFGQFDVKVFKLAFSYSIFVFIATIVDQVNWNFGQLVVGAYRGTSEVAVYSIALLFNTTFIMLSTAVSNVLLPKVSKMISDGATDNDLSLEMIKIGRLQSYIVLLVLFGFALFGKVFVVFWAGKEYEDAYYLTLIIMVPLSIPLMQNLGLSILKAKNKFVFRAMSSLIMSFFTILMSLLLTNEYGYWGVAISISITFFLLNGVIMNVYYKYIGLNILSFWKQISIVILVMLSVFFLFFMYIQLIEIDSIFKLVFNIPIFIFIVFVTLYLCVMNEYEKGIIKSITNKTFF
ncbi:oligosaccharide flippase family protein [Shewanella psychromarinicola]|uniref:Virulence factor MviN n=1 Tax=Shewanella psychromarinicola TaxID=2487742 RepID=A0A3N4EF23_9GAMM|nr:oligosaccharide flippase family protein [Shewanella psychromarinicola]AZG35355.1 virulence factor MviN [Shewanella psychromarinicola]MCL1083611.1 oligosaccharide flippase family protein [Shewanella psychromarinicola]RPA32840.1 virulence factor MviN [Shewanella psychromarinicola]